MREEQEKQWEKVEKAVKELRDPGRRPEADLHGFKADIDNI
jgi:hypothetical protein